MTFHLNQVVYAKVKGYRHWPGEITLNDDSNSYFKGGPSRFCYNVVFFGDGRQAWVETKSIRPLTLENSGPHRHKDFITKGNQGESHQRGLDEARELLQARGVIDMGEAGNVVEEPGDVIEGAEAGAVIEGEGEAEAVIEGSGEAAAVIEEAGEAGAVIEEAGEGGDNIERAGADVEGAGESGDVVDMQEVVGDDSCRMGTFQTLDVTANNPDDIKMDVDIEADHRHISGDVNKDPRETSNAPTQETIPTSTDLCPETFNCQYCSKQFKHKHHLSRHVLWRCPKAPHIQDDPAEVLVRNRREREESLALDTDPEGEKDRKEQDDEQILRLEKVTKVYQIDEEQAEYLSGSVSDDYARFWFCERNSVTVPGFWPILLDFRHKRTLLPIEENICSSKGHQVLSSILTAGYIIHDKDSITISKLAFVEQSGNFYDVSPYRIPTSAITQHSHPRLNRPVFSVTSDKDFVTISLHPSYKALLPTPQRIPVTIDSSAGDNDEEEEMDFDLTDTFMHTPGIDEDDEATDEVDDEVGEDDDTLSQTFSQCSLEDFQSPLKKRIKKSEASPKPEEQSESGSTTPTTKVDNSSSYPPQEGDDGGGDDPLRLRGGMGRRQPRPPPPPNAIRHPDPDHLPPRQQRAIIPIINSLQVQRSYRESRWIAGRGAPSLQGNQLPNGNQLWNAVVNRFQLPWLFKPHEFEDLIFATEQQLYEFRDNFVIPMLQQLAQNAQGARGAAASVPRALTPDAIAFMTLFKMKHANAHRVIGPEFGTFKKTVDKWPNLVRNFTVQNHQWIQRVIHLEDGNNLADLLQDAVAATNRDPRAQGIYGHLRRPGDRLAVMAVDGRAIMIQKSTDPYLQGRTYSTKIHDNAIQKITVSDSDGLPLASFALSVSISPAGTDESNSEVLITLNEAGVPGGFRCILEASRLHNVTLVVLPDFGFWKWGFDREHRRSFTDYLDTVKQNSNGGFHYFLPRKPTDPYVDTNFNDVASYQNLPGGIRHR